MLWKKTLKMYEKSIDFIVHIDYNVSRNGGDRMKKLKLKKEVKGALIVIGVIVICLINVFTHFNNVTHDELGNTCRGGIVKICNR